MIVEGALLPGHGLDGAWHGGGLECRRSVRMEGVADGVDSGEGSLGGQRESVLVLRLWGKVGYKRGGEKEVETQVAQKEMVRRGNRIEGIREERRCRRKQHQCQWNV